MTKKQAMTRARKGAAYLDSKLGSGWRRRIRRTRLDLASGVYVPEQANSCGCVLAQLAPKNRYSNQRLFGNGARRVGLSSKKWASHGFILADNDRYDEYPVLTEAWREVLREG